jgi:hypothetical protein
MPLLQDAKNVSGNEDIVDAAAVRVKHAVQAAPAGGSPGGTRRENHAIM